MPASKEYHKQYKRDYKKSHKNINIGIPINIYECFKKIAIIEETSVGALVRKMAIEQLTNKPTLEKKDKEKLNELSLLIRNIANNINQIAHHSNTIKGLVDENQLLGHIKKLEETVMEYTEDKIINK